MADLVQTPASVVNGTPSQTSTGVAGAAIVAGNAVYKRNADQLWYPAVANGTAEQAGQYGAGVALDSAPGANQPITIQTAGQVNLGATLAVGQAYVISPSGTAGAISPITVLASTNFVSIIGVAITASLLLMPWSGVFTSNVQKP